MPNANTSLSRTKIVIFTTVAAFLLPVAFCVVDRYMYDFAIGAVVLFYSAASVFLFIPLFAWGLRNVLTEGMAAVAAVFLGIICSVLLLNFFIGLTFLFGIKDYHLM